MTPWRENRLGTTRPDDEMGSQIGHVTSPHDHRACISTCLDSDEKSNDQFEIPFRHQGASFLVDFLAKKRELTGKTFTTPLTSPNPNIYVKVHFHVEFPFNTSRQFMIKSIDTRTGTGVVTLEVVSVNIGVLCTKDHFSSLYMWRNIGVKRRAAIVV